MASKAATSLFLGICSLGAGIVTVNNKPLTLTFFTFAAFCFLVLFAQLGHIMNEFDNNISPDSYTPLLPSRFPPVDESRFAPILRLPSAPFLNDNPTEIFGGFLKSLK